MIEENYKGKWKMRNGKSCIINGESKLLKATDGSTIWSGTIDESGYSHHWLGPNSIEHRDFDLMKRQRGDEEI